MDGRDAFLTMARERHYEFSSLRRCKYSTMSLLYELHTQGNDKFVYTCNSCNKSVETRYVQHSIMIMILFYFISKIDRFPPDNLTKNLALRNDILIHIARYVSREVKYGKKSFQHLTTFFMSTWWGDSKNMKEIEFSRWLFEIAAK